MNFKKYYINGNKFTIRITFRPERYWNDLMLSLTRITSPVPLSVLIYREMVKNPPELLYYDYDPIILITIDVKERMKQIRKNLLK